MKGAEAETDPIVDEGNTADDSKHGPTVPHPHVSINLNRIHPALSIECRQNAKYPNAPAIETTDWFVLSDSNTQTGLKSPLSNYELTNISFVSFSLLQDVLCGRGGQSNNHPGNEW